MVRKIFNRQLLYQVSHVARALQVITILLVFCKVLQLAILAALGHAQPTLLVWTLCHFSLCIVATISAQKRSASGLLAVSLTPYCKSILLLIYSQFIVAYTTLLVLTLVSIFLPIAANIGSNDEAEEAESSKKYAVVDIKVEIQDHDEATDDLPFFLLITELLELLLWVRQIA